MGNNKKSYLSAIVLAGAMLGSTSVYATDCTPPATFPSASYPMLANGLAAGWQKIIDGTETSFKPNPNKTVCVDILNGLDKNFVVFDIDTPVTKDGTVDGTPSAFNHMWLMSSANLAYIKNVLKNTSKDVSDNFSVKGIIHGSALKWALNDAWWQEQVDKYGNQLYPDGNPNKVWFDKLNWLKDHGIDVQLEVCAVTLSGAGLTHDDVYPGILVNQGAFGRMSKLHQQGYAIMTEGWVDNDAVDDKHRHKDRDPR
jgi:intracellular sulfur oxidation DsrE/DsrF family protein